MEIENLFVSPADCLTGWHDTLTSTCHAANALPSSRYLSDRHRRRALRVACLDKLKLHVFRFVVDLLLIIVVIFQILISQLLCACIVCICFLRGYVSDGYTPPFIACSIPYVCAVADLFLVYWMDTTNCVNKQNTKSTTNRTSGVWAIPYSTDGTARRDGANGEGWAESQGLLQLRLHCDFRSKIIFVFILILVHENIPAYHKACTRSEVYRELLLLRSILTQWTVTILHHVYLSIIFSARCVR